MVLAGSRHRWGLVGMLRVRATSCCWPLATLHLLAEGLDHCVIHGQRTAFFVTFEVNDILILAPGEERQPFSFPPKKIIIKARKFRKFPSVIMLNEQSKMKQIDNMIWFPLLESDRKFGSCCPRASRCSPRGP